MATETASKFYALFQTARASRNKNLPLEILSERRGHPVVNIAEKRDRCILLRCRCIMVNIIFAFSATTYGCYIQLIARSSKPFAEDMPWNNIKPCCGERGVFNKTFTVVLLTNFLSWWQISKANKNNL